MVPYVDSFKLCVCLLYYKASTLLIFSTSSLISFWKANFQVNLRIMTSYNCIQKDYIYELCDVNAENCSELPLNELPFLSVACHLMLLYIYNMNRNYLWTVLVIIIPFTKKKYNIMLQTYKDLLAHLTKLFKFHSFSFP